MVQKDFVADLFGCRASFRLCRQCVRGQSDTDDFIIDFSHSWPCQIWRRHCVQRSRLVVCWQEDMAVSGEIKLFRNGPNGSTLIVLTDDYRTYVVKHLQSVAVKKALVGLCSVHVSFSAH